MASYVTCVYLYEDDEVFIELGMADGCMFV